jgi:uncharacterized membrane protein
MSIDQAPRRFSPKVRRVLRYGLALFFTVGGIAHFVKPDAYAALVPPQLPWPYLLVYVSGVAELVFGLGLLTRYQRWAAWGIVATLIAVYPANIYHAVSGGLDDPRLPDGFASATGAWIRLPFQFLFIAWAWMFTRADPPA